MVRGLLTSIVVRLPRAFALSFSVLFVLLVASFVFLLCSGPVALLRAPVSFPVFPWNLTRRRSRVLPPPGQIDGRWPLPRQMKVFRPSRPTPGIADGRRTLGISPVLPFFALPLPSPGVRFSHSPLLLPAGGWTFSDVIVTPVVPGWLEFLLCFGFCCFFCFV